MGYSPEPRRVHDRKRMQALMDAIEGAARNESPIQLDWVEEYNELIHREQRARETQKEALKPEPHNTIHLVSFPGDVFSACQIDIKLAKAGKSVSPAEVTCRHCKTYLSGGVGGWLT